MVMHAGQRQRGRRCGVVVGWWLVPVSRSRGRGVPHHGIPGVDETVHIAASVTVRRDPHLLLLLGRVLGLHALVGVLATGIHGGAGIVADVDLSSGVHAL